MTPPTVGQQVFQVSVAGSAIRVARTHIGNGHPLVLINGIGAAIEMWQPFVDQLDEREIVCLDLPGCGLSPAPLLPMRMRQIAKVVVGVMDVLGIPRADVLGYSFGGVVALELARRFPDRIRRLILASTAPGTPGALPHPAVLAMMLSPLRYYNRHAAEMIIPLIAGGQTARDAGQMRSGVTRRLIHPPQTRGYLYQLMAISTFTSWPWLHRIRHRALVVHGRDDPVSPALNARLMAATLPDAQLRIVSGGGHLMLLDEPARIAPAIIEFLESQRPVLVTSRESRDEPTMHPDPL